VSIACLIVNGRIAQIGASVSTPPDALQIDADGLVVYPGFIDANTHAGVTAAEPSDEERARWEDENPDVLESPQSATVEAHRRLMHPRWKVEELYDPQASKLEDHRAAGFTAALVSPKPAIFPSALPSSNSAICP
jgi:cytosine/adenosine deaminase-related metal-dependent hydrolase